MRKVSLQKADIDGANFRDTDLTNADLSDVIHFEKANFDNCVMVDAKMPRAPWYINYLHSLNVTELKERLAKMMEGILFSPAEIELLGEYAVLVKSIEDKDIPQKDNEVVDLVKHLTDSELGTEERYSTILRLHSLLISSKKEENMVQFIGCNGQAVIGLMTFDDRGTVRCAANSLLTCLSSHHSTSAREFAFSTLSDSLIVDLKPMATALHK